MMATAFNSEHCEAGDGVADEDTRCYRTHFPVAARVAAQLKLAAHTH